MTEVNEIIKNCGSDSILFAHKAFLLLEDKEINKALELCEAGAKRFPFYAEGHFILGKCYQANKQYDEAKEEYERTLVYMPGHIRAYNALSFIYHKKNLPAKGNDLLLLAAIHNPFNTDLINYLKNENIYGQLYAGSEVAATADQKQPDAVDPQKPASPDVEDQVIPDDLSADIEELLPQGDNEMGSFEADIALTEWERDADQMKAEDLLPFDFSEKDIEDSTIQFGDSEIIDFEKDHGSDLEEKLLKDDEKENEESKEPVIWEPEGDDDAGSEDSFDTDINDIPIQDSDLDESYLLDEDENDEFFLGPESAEDDEDTTKIDNYASSKDENTELSIEQYEVNSIVDNIIESDKKDSSKPDLSKFANMEDDFSTLMDGIFEKNQDISDEELFEDDLGDNPDTENFDDTEMAEERPILDTSIIFPNRKKSNEEIEDDTSDISELNIQDDVFDDMEFDIPEADSDFTEEEDEITKVIDKIEKAGEQPRKLNQPNEQPDKGDSAKEMDDLVPVDDENVNIDEILANPKMLTPTFGEILIAQKKFEDARRVFTELSKRDPENQRLTRKIDFLDKLVQFNK